MGAREEAVVRSFLDCIVARDLEAATDHFADDGRYHVNAWDTPLVGKDAVRRGVAAEVALAGYHYTILNMASTDHVVLFEVIDGHERDGRDITMHWCGAWEIDDATKITARRDYYDSKEFVAQLG